MNFVKLKIELLYYLATPLFYKHPKLTETKTHTNLYMFVAMLFVIAKKWTQMSISWWMHKTNMA
jgi:hypothetical protein